MMFVHTLYIMHVLHELHHDHRYTYEANEIVIFVMHGLFGFYNNLFKEFRGGGLSQVV